MRRTALLALAALLAGCGGSTVERPRAAPQAAGPQQAELDWREPYPDGSGERLVFEVDEFEVTNAGWRATVAVTNRTSVSWDARAGAASSRYGVMLFATGDLGELEAAARAGSLPATREATRIEPEPPTVLAPGATWRAVLSAPGALAARTHVRVVFGPLTAQADPPEDLEPTVVWITDASYRLRA